MEFLIISYSIGNRHYRFRYFIIRFDGFTPELITVDFTDVLLITSQFTSWVQFRLPQTAKIGRARIQMRSILAISDEFEV